MREVYSSVVAAVDYIEGNLLVRWQRARPGKTISIYAGVPEKLAHEVMNAASIGQALRNSIQGVYEHRYGDE